MDVYTSPLAWKVIGAAIEVHKALGPGLLESAYDRALAHELTLRALRFSRQVALPAEYKGARLGPAYRVDFVVEDELLVELKTVKALLPIHRSQLRTYVQMLGVRQGLLFNFSAHRLIDGLVSVLMPVRNETV